MTLMATHYSKASLHAAVTLYTPQCVLIPRSIFISAVTVTKVLMNDTTRASLFRSVALQRR